MHKGKDDTERELRHRTDGGTVVTGPEEVRIDSVQNSAGTETVTTSVEQSTVEAHPIQIDQVFELLKNQRRRWVLRYLQTVEDEVKLGTLAEQIAAWECDKPVSHIQSNERKRVYVGLYQSHLPKMDDVGAISYNKPRGKIKPGENRQLFEHYLPGETANAERAWTKYHWVLPLLLGLLALVLGPIWLLA